ncbi:GNAT family N-acetyltransferase [Cellulophaga sp. E16_2]|uniref:GCN5-related N-acetyltransferase n=1 Tax=Cellulophaga algicola (strain DSM 14237 / IC166 / ACAM 630) TaxID=688270 RepID=E6X6P5_CELAD|nr:MULTISPECIES: GNAT family N-acetyltransferase [Cellulophaga]ADV49583.1 GCN5-related N-acetyltransferase [Cellulophaga algicola DSM 14237]MBO0592033.1 GNAT family N-acetyltransferase [Cellulophaga sp. E16_2]
MNTITIRDAVAKDLPILLAFEQGIVKAERPFDPTLAEDPISYYDIEKFIKDGRSKVVVACIGGKIAGSGFATILTAKNYLVHEEYVNLHFMYTAPDYRGQGVNALIMNTLKEWAHSKNIKEVRLTVYQDNLPAIKAYEKVGFKKHIIEMRLV